MRSIRKIAWYLAVIMVAGSMLQGSVQAAEEGYWYFDDFGIADAHAEGIDGTGIKIADIDTPVNLELPWLISADVVLLDKAITKYYGDIPPVSDNFDIAYHATDMISLLQGNAQGAQTGGAPDGLVPGATIYHYAAVTSEDDEVTGGDVYDEAVRMALEDNVDLILIPAGGKSDYDLQYPYLLEAIRRGIPVLIAHSNAHNTIDQNTAPEVYLDEDGALLNYDELPTGDDRDEICYWPGLVTVQALDENYAVQSDSRINDAGTNIAAPGEDIWMQWNSWGYFEARGGGCSAAATVTAGYLALAMQKWPQASGNQILQLMVRTTSLQDDGAMRGGADAVLQLTRDPETGFGTVDPVRMLATDPTTLPDVNPILYLDIAQTVKNAEARNDTEALVNPNLIEIAEVLDEQLSREGEARPDFLTAILDEEEEEEVVEEEPEEEPVEEEEEAAPEETAVTEAEETKAEPEEALPEEVPEKEERDRSGIRGLMPLIVVGGVIIICVMALVSQRKNKAE